MNPRMYQTGLNRHCSRCHAVVNDRTWDYHYYKHLEVDRLKGDGTDLREEAVELSTHEVGSSRDELLRTLRELA